MICLAEHPLIYDMRIVTYMLKGHRENYEKTSAVLFKFVNTNTATNN